MRLRLCGISPGPRLRVRPPLRAAILNKIIFPVPSALPSFRDFLLVTVRSTSPCARDLQMLRFRDHPRAALSRQKRLLSAGYAKIASSARRVAYSVRRRRRPSWTESQVLGRRQLCSLLEAAGFLEYVNAALHLCTVVITRIGPPHGGAIQ